MDVCGTLSTVQGGVLVLIIHSLHPARDACEHLVGDGAERVGEHRYGQVVAKDFHAVSLLAGNVGHVYQCHVHADVAHIGCLLPVHQTIAVAVAQVSVQTVGIAYGDSGDDAVAFQRALAAIAHRVFLLHVAQLQYGGLQCAHGMQDSVVARVYSVES